MTQESGLQNISAKETKNLSPLAKDVLVLQKDLASIVGQIKTKSAELDGIDKSIVELRNEFKKVSALKQPLIDSLVSKIAELRKINSALELSVIRLKKEEDLIKTRIEITVKEVNQRKEEAEMGIEMARKQFEMAERQLGSIARKIEDSSAFFEKLEGNVDVKLAVEEEIKKLAQKRAILIDEISAFEERKEDVMALFKDLNKYRDELDGREKELVKNYQQVLLMKNRLKPRYLKIFKKYSNL